SDSAGLCEACPLREPRTLQRYSIRLHFTARPLDIAAPTLGFQTPPLGGGRGPSRLARPRPLASRLQQRQQPLAGILAVTLPAAVRRRPASRRSCCLISSGKRLASTSKRSCTAVATLFTFCPPGPDARTNDSLSSLSSIHMPSATRIIAWRSVAEVIELQRHS